MQILTDELLKELKNASDIASFFQTYENQFMKETPCSLLNSLLETKKLTVSQIAKDSGVGEYVYKVFRGDRTPSRDILIAIAFGMKLSIEETQLLLRISKFAILDAKNKRDSILIFGLTHGLDIFATDDLLDEQNMVTVNG